MQTAIKLAGDGFSPANNFSPDFPDDADLKAEFRGIILPFPDKRLAKSAGCSPQTVKCWKAERAFPQGRHLMKLVKDFPEISAWHSRRTGGLQNPQSEVEVFAKLEEIMASNTAKGRAMRARFQQIVAEGA